MAGFWSRRGSGCSPAGREYDPEDTVRFYALRLQELGFIKSSPQKIISQSVDWRFLNEIKRDLKTRSWMPVKDPHAHHRG